MTESHVASGTPQEEEPKTPMWLPALGAALFVGIALWWAVVPAGVSQADAQAAAAASASAAAAGSAPAAQGAPNPQVRPAIPAQQAANALPAPAPAASGSAARRAMPSALPPEVQKRLNDLRGKPHP